MEVGGVAEAGVVAEVLGARPFAAGFLFAAEYASVNGSLLTFPGSLLTFPGSLLAAKLILTQWC